MQRKEADVVVRLIKEEDMTETIMPYTETDYSIFYKAGEFQLSPTYFIDGLSTELWIFIWSYFLLFFLGLLISVKVYRRFLGVPQMTVSDVAMFEMNFVTNQSHELPTKEHEKFLSWKIQMICQSVFNIIIACAFSAFILTLLSIQTSNVSFKSLEDFSNRRTHMICGPNTYSTYGYFETVSANGSISKLKTEFVGIFNDIQQCARPIFKRTDELLCKSGNLALIVPVNKFIE